MILRVGSIIPYETKIKCFKASVFTDSCLSRSFCCFKRQRKECVMDKCVFKLFRCFVVVFV